MWRYFDVDIPTFGILLVVCGLICVLMGLTRRAYAPRVSFLCGLLLLLCGGLMWLVPRLHIPSQSLTRIEFLLVGIALLSVDLVNWYKRLKCTVPCQGEFLDITTYGRRRSGLSCGSAVFRYQVAGVSYQQASLEKRFWLGFLDSPFLKKYTAGECYTIYLNPNTPRHFALSRRPRFGILSVCGVALLAAFLRS